MDRGPAGGPWKAVGSSVIRAHVDGVDVAHAAQHVSALSIRQAL